LLIGEKAERVDVAWADSAEVTLIEGDNQVGVEALREGDDGGIDGA
jgi:hypothetical protein